MGRHRSARIRRSGSRTAVFCEKKVRIIPVVAKKRLPPPFLEDLQPLVPQHIDLVPKEGLEPSRGVTLTGF